MCCTEQCDYSLYQPIPHLLSPKHPPIIGFICPLPSFAFSIHDVLLDLDPALILAHVLEFPLHHSEFHFLQISFPLQPADTSQR